MRLSVRKWGNSLALRIPKSVAEDSRISHGSVVDLAVRQGRLVVTPLARGRRYTLDQLLAGVTKGNRHREVDTGAAQGREAW